MSLKLHMRRSTNSAKRMVIDTSPVMSRSSIPPLENSSTLAQSTDTSLLTMVCRQYIDNNLALLNILAGLRIMAFGVLYDFTGNSNVSKVIKARDLVKESWFLDAVNYPQPIDLFVLLGHNPVRTTVSSSTFGIIYNTIRGQRPNIPIQAFGGHTHIRCVSRAKKSLVYSLNKSRDFVVYDTISTGLESGQLRFPCLSF